MKGTWFIVSSQKLLTMFFKVLILMPKANMTYLIILSGKILLDHVNHWWVI